jgi:hypothetical protein
MGINAKTETSIGTEVIDSPLLGKKYADMSIAKETAK